MVDNNETLNLSFQERTKEFEKIKKEVQDSIILTSDPYGKGILLAKKLLEILF